MSKQVALIQTSLNIDSTLFDAKIIQISPTSKTLQDYFISRRDAKGNAMSVQTEDDWNLTLTAVKNQINYSKQKLSLGVINQEIVTVENRLPWLLKYEKMMLNSNHWDEIGFIKNEFRNQNHSGKIVDLAKFDDELQYFEQRQNRRKNYDKRILKQIAQVDPQNLANELLKQQEHLGMQNEADWNVEQNKLSDEIQRWKIRSFVTYGACNAEKQSSNDTDFSCCNSEFEIILQQQWDSMQLDDFVLSSEFNNNDDVKLQLKHGTFATEKSSFFLTEEEMVSPKYGNRASTDSCLHQKQELQIKNMLKDLKGQASFQQESARTLSEFTSTEEVDISIPIRSNTPIIKHKSKTTVSTTSPTIKFKPAQTKYLEHLVVEIGVIIGVGGFSKVYMGTILDSQEKVAVKIVKAKSNSVKKVMKLEITMLKQLHHPNVVRYLGFDYNSDLREYSLVLEYCGDGNLEEMVLKEGPFKEEKAAFILYQILNGLLYLKQNHIIHRDIKPGNILKKSNEEMYLITDFGVSINLMNMEVNSESVQGTPHYAAPEIISIKPYGFAVDVWSLGSTLFELVTGKRPYDECNPFTAMYKTVTYGHPPIPNHLSPECIDFLEQCWIYDDASRPTIEEILLHSFVKKRTGVNL